MLLLYLLVLIVCNSGQAFDYKMYELQVQLHDWLKWYCKCKGVISFFLSALCILLEVRIGTLMDIVSSKTLQWTLLTFIKSTDSENRLAESYWKLKQADQDGIIENARCSEVACTSSQCLIATPRLDQYLYLYMCYHRFVHHIGHVILKSDLISIQSAFAFLGGLNDFTIVFFYLPV